MNIRNLRTKTKASLLVLLFILIVIPISLSLNRTITDTQDTFTTFIKNSNGNYWIANSSNVQVAIDELGSDGGIVWLPGSDNFTITSTLIIRDKIRLEMQGSTIAPSGDFDVISLRPGSQIKGGIINVSSVGTFDSSAITFNATDNYSFRNHISRIQDLELISASLRGTGILFATQGSTAQAIVNTETNNVRMIDFEYGILLNNTGTNAYIKSNTFSDIYGHGNKYFIKVFESQSAIEGNYFFNIQHNCTSNTEYIIWNNGRGNIYDTIIAYNWNNNSGAKVAYNFSTSGVGHEGADQIFLSFRGGSGDIAIGNWSVINNSYTILDYEAGNLTLGEVNELG